MSVFILLLQHAYFLLQHLDELLISLQILLYLVLSLQD